MTDEAHGAAQSMNARKKFIIGGAIAAAVVAIVSVIVVLMLGRKFRLSDGYYGAGEFINVSSDELRQAVDERKSFALLIWQPGCLTSTDFEKVVKSFSEAEKVSFLRMEFSDVKMSGLVEGLKYYPSVALFRDGKMATFLHSDSDEDLSALQSEEGFREWWEKYIKE